MAVFFKSNNLTPTGGEKTWHQSRDPKQCFVNHVTSYSMNGLFGELFIDFLARFLGEVFDQIFGRVSDQGFWSQHI